MTASNGDKLICVQIMTKAAAQSVWGSDMNLPVAAQSHPASSSLPGLASVIPDVEAGTLAVSFSDCGDASTDAVVKDVVPKTITAGSTTTITGSGSLKKDITGGSYDMRMTGVLSSVLVKNCNGDASKANTCDIVAPLLGKVGTIAYQPVAFPIKAGDISGVPKVAVTLKAGLPASLETTTTTLKVRVFDFSWKLEMSLVSSVRYRTGIDEQHCYQQREFLLQKFVIPGCVGRGLDLNC